MYDGPIRLEMEERTSDGGRGVGAVAPMEQYRENWGMGASEDQLLEWPHGPPFTIPSPPIWASGQYES